MSGGHFQYDQHKIASIADDVRELIASNNDKSKNSWGDTVGRGYGEETIQRFRDAEATLRRAYIYAQRIDWLVSGDDGEDSFHRRLREEMEALNALEP